MEMQKAAAGTVMEEERADAVDRASSHLEVLAALVEGGWAGAGETVAGLAVVATEVVITDLVAGEVVTKVAMVGRVSSPLEALAAGVAVETASTLAEVGNLEASAAAAETASIHLEALVDMTGAALGTVVVDTAAAREGRKAVADAARAVAVLMVAGTGTATVEAADLASMPQVVPVTLEAVVQEPAMVAAEGVASSLLEGRVDEAATHRESPWSQLQARIVLTPRALEKPL